MAKYLASILVCMILTTGVCIADDDDDEMSAEEILEEYEEELEEVEDVHCKFFTFNQVGETVERKTLELWFKKPGMARSLVLQGDNEGGVATIDAEGVIKGKKGGALGLLVLTLKPDDDRLRNIRGEKFYQAAWESIFGDFKARLERDGWKLAREKDAKIMGKKCFVLSASGPADEAGVTKDLIYIEKEDWIMLRHQEYEGELKANEGNYTDIEVNTDIEDSMFTL